MQQRDSSKYLKGNIMNIKTIAKYLPQFHRTPENDAWWGEGFTEWTAVRGAKPLFEGHEQPKIPMNGYYYNLLKKETMIQQTEWMKEYKIDGQCFYHYYFADGRKILEKPAENLLQWTDIDMPFCFCWANGSWSRTWSNIPEHKWSWTELYEKKLPDESDDGVLLRQKYGREKDWEEHFTYLLPFFRDKRYIKAEGKPIFLIDHPNCIPCLPQMLDCWRQLAEENGLAGIYVTGAVINHIVEGMGLDAVLLRGPHSFWKLKDAEGGIYRPNYDELWENTLSAPPVPGYKSYYEATVNYDDTGRRGRHNGIVVDGFSVDKFYDGMKKLYKKSVLSNNEFVFINAWNEWGEGMYLEPDEHNGFGMLEAVRKAQTDAEGELQNTADRGIETGGEDKTYYPSVGLGSALQCFNQWMTLRERGIGLADYLHGYGIRSVAVYGYGMLGVHLVAELDKSDIEIRYIVDQNRNLHPPKYKIISPDEKLPMVDAVIVSPVRQFAFIYQKLKGKTESRIFSLMELTSELV